MKIKSKSYGDELEIVKIPINKVLTITVEVFKVPDPYKNIVRNFLFIIMTYRVLEHMKIKMRVLK
jgi:hypothetical protein